MLLIGLEDRLCQDDESSVSILGGKGYLETKFYFCFVLYPLVPTKSTCDIRYNSCHLWTGPRAFLSLCIATALETACWKTARVTNWSFFIWRRRCCCRLERELRSSHEDVLMASIDS